MTLRTAGTLRRRVNKTNPKAPKRRKEGGNILPTLYNPLALPLLWKPQETEQLSVYPGCLPTPAAEAATLPRSLSTQGRASCPASQGVLVSSLQTSTTHFLPSPLPTQACHLGQTLTLLPGRHALHVTEGLAS